MNNNSTGRENSTMKQDIPPLVPYLGNEEKNFIGGGIAGAGGNADGSWDFLIGPMYSSPNFIEREEIVFIVDGTEYQLDMKMHRGSGSGIFYGVQTIEGLQIILSDFSPFVKPYVIRRFVINNTSMIKNYSFSIKATIIPCNKYLSFSFGEKITQRFEEDLSSRISIIDGKGILIHQDTSAHCYGGENINWIDRFALIAFNYPSMSSALPDSRYEISTHCKRIAPGEDTSFGLIHYMHSGSDNNFNEHLKVLSRLDHDFEYNICLEEWDRWVGKGKYKICKDTRVKNIIESSLVFIKMQQCVDGGFIAGVRRYSFSYIRDGHGAIRGLLATGHYEEVKQFIKWVHHKCEIFGMIPNSAEMGADLKMLQFVNPENLASETTAYYILAVRDYFKQTRDLDFLIELESSLGIAIDTQLKYAEKFDWKLMFNGDETERYVPFRDGDIYGGFPALPDWNDEDWSMTALAACIVSIEFYLEYLKLIGKKESIKILKDKLDLLRCSLDRNFWNSELEIFNWCKKKDGSTPNYTVTTMNLIPQWIGLSLPSDRQVANSLAMVKCFNNKGYLPIAPGLNEGFCGHSLGYLLYALAEMKNSKCHRIFQSLINGNTIGCWGTVSEFYGPNGKANPHNLRIFESGINLEAIIKYLDYSSSLDTL